MEDQKLDLSERTVEIGPQNIAFYGLGFRVQSADRGVLMEDQTLDLGERRVQRVLRPLRCVRNLFEQNRL